MKRLIERATQAAIICLVVATAMAGTLTGCLTPQGELDADATEQALREYGPLAAGLLSQYMELRQNEVAAHLAEVREVAETITDIVVFAETLAKPTKASPEARIAELETQATEALEKMEGIE